MTKKFFWKLAGIVFILMLFGCREQEKFNENFSPQKPHQDGVEKNVTFKTFQNETKVNFTEIVSGINSKFGKSLTNLNAKNSIPISDFDIDTTFIKKLLYQNNQTSFSIRAFKRGENPNTNCYNIVYHKENNVWTAEVFKYSYTSQYLVSYNANAQTPFAGTIEHLGTIGTEKALKTGDIIKCSYTIQVLCNCMDHTVYECQGCPQGFRNVGTLNCTTVTDSGGNDATTNPYNPTISNPPFNDGSYQPTGNPYDIEYSNNLPAFDDAAFLANTWKCNLWNALGYLQNDFPDIYWKFEDYQVQTQGQKLQNLINLSSFLGNNTDFANWGIDFLLENLNVTPAQFSNWFIDGDSLTSAVAAEFINDLSNPNIVKPTKRLKKNTLLNCIYNKAKNAPNFQQYLQNFYGNFSTAHLLLDVKPLTNSNSNAQTSPPNGYWITITINSNNLNRPSLDIARTFMHEMIHAEMFRILLSLAPTSNGQIDVVELTNMLNSNNYPGIYDYFRRFGLNNMQHEQMASHYRGIIKNYLKQIDSSITDSQAEAMAWVGLQGTVAWNNLGTSGQNNILSIYNAWKNNATHSCP